MLDLSDPITLPSFLPSFQISNGVWHDWDSQGCYFVAILLLYEEVRRYHRHYQHMPSKLSSVRQERKFLSYFLEVKNILIAMATDDIVTAFDIDIIKNKHPEDLTVFDY